jgi:hypothetical protein
MHAYTCICNGLQAERLHEEALDLARTESTVISCEPALKKELAKQIKSAEGARRCRARYVQVACN